MNKSSLRNQLRSQRRSLSAAEQLRAANQLTQGFFQLGFHLRYKRIGLYWPNDGEIDPRFLMSRLLAMGKRCFLPVLSPINTDRIYFGEYQHGCDMSENRFGILEPSGSKMAPIWSLDIVLMPLVGFDVSANRLGMGGGFYDRSFAFTLRTKPSPALIGLAHQCQKVKTLELDHWDIRLQGILTDQAYIPAR